MTALYLAGPIDMVSKEQARGWRESLAAKFPQVLFYLPTHAYANASMEQAMRVERYNRAAVLASDGILVNLLAERPSVGTVRELEFAVSSGIPAVVVASRVLSDKSIALHDVPKLTDLEDGVFKLMELTTVMTGLRPDLEEYRISMVTKDALRRCDLSDEHDPPGTAYYFKRDIRWLAFHLLSGRKMV